MVPLNYRANDRTMCFGARYREGHEKRRHLGEPRTLTCGPQGKDSVSDLSAAPVKVSLPREPGVLSLPVPSKDPTNSFSFFIQYHRLLCVGLVPQAYK